MDSVSNWNWNLIAPNALPPSDDETHDHAIASTIEKSLQAAHRKKNRGTAEIADNPRVHEIIEGEMIDPAPVSTGK